MKEVEEFEFTVISRYEQVQTAPGQFVWKHRFDDYRRLTEAIAAAIEKSKGGEVELQHETSEYTCMLATFRDGMEVIP